MEQNKKVEFKGKIAKMPKNTKASKAYNFLENVHISKRKLWYFIIEQEVLKSENDSYQELQLIKYNNKRGVDCTKFVEDLKKYYAKNEKLAVHLNGLKVEGEDKFSIIRNIPKVEIDGKKFISIIMEDLMKLLSTDNTNPGGEDELD